MTYYRYFAYTSRSKRLKHVRGLLNSLSSWLVVGLTLWALYVLLCDTRLADYLVGGL